MTTEGCLTLNRAQSALLPAFAVVIGIYAKSTVGGNWEHEIVAIITADNLTSAAREQAVRILGSAPLLAGSSLKLNSDWQACRMASG
jgi:hypothetical protein